MDSRFHHVASDPRFKPLKAKKTFISPDDNRFKSIQQNAALHKTVDPRGRKFNIKQLRARKDAVLERTLDRESSSNLLSSSKKRRREGKSDDNDASSDSDVQRKDSSDPEEDDSDNEGFNNDAVEQYVEKDENDQLVEQMQENIKVKTKKKVLTDKEKRMMEQILDPDMDIVRGVNTYSDSEPSSEEDSSSSEEEEEEYDWGQLDKDAQWDVDGNTVEETKRLAVCNLEWDRFNAQDILVVLNSFAPKGGKVCKVSVFLSEFGKERLAEDQRMGPKEVRELPSLADDEDHNEKNYEAMRKFCFNRLKYYYAVAECNSVETARVIYKTVDGTCFRNGGIIDLRYIPDHMVFDETPESSCSTIPATYTRTTADKFLSANYSKTKFDWDDDLDDRKKNLEKFADADQVKDDAALNEILAFESDDEDELEGNEDSDVMEFTSEFESVKSEDRSKRVELYRELMANLHTYDPVKEAERQLLQKALGDEAADAMDSKDDTHMEMEVEFSSDEESDEEKADKKSKSTDNLTPFEKYLKKRDDKQKQKKKAKKEAITGKKLIIDKEDEDIPDDLKNDPFFREELALRRKERLKLMKEHRDEQDAEMAQEELAKEEREKEMALLMLDDDGSVSRGVDMRELVQQAKQDAGGKKKLSRWKLSKLKIKEKRLAKQGVVLQDIDKQTSVDHNAAPVAAKDAVTDERFSGIFKNWRANLDPSHPEFSKHHTPFMDALVEEVQAGARAGKQTKKRRTQK